MPSPATTPDSCPDFSVVIPIYNRPEEARAVLAPFLRPDAKGIEVIVVDDGSQDNTAEVVEAIARQNTGADIRLIRQENAGPGPARNAGVAAARSDWILFHDSDDIWMPWAIETFRKVIADPATARADILFWAARIFHQLAELDDVENGAIRLRKHPTMLDMKLDDPLPLYASCNLGIRKSVFEALGGFASEVRHSEDTDLLYRANETGEVVVIAAPEVMGYRETTAGTASQTNSGDKVRRKRTLFLIDRYNSGLYPGPKKKVNMALARTMGFTIRSYFSQGFIASAYIVYRQSLLIFVRAGLWGELIKLPLTPVLSLVRPKNYVMRWRRLF